jgi:hypothetical protein
LRWVQPNRPSTEANNQTATGTGTAVSRKAFCWPALVCGKSDHLNIVHYV